ncbi:hypothetical protein ACFWX1_47165, partial [Amycolatopsis sp. NPDC059021]
PHPLPRRSRPPPPAQAPPPPAPQPETAARVAAIQQRHDDEVVALLDEHSRRLRLEPAMPLHQAVVMLGALGIGLALRQTVAPAADPAAILSHVLDTVFPPPEHR